MATDTKPRKYKLTPTVKQRRAAQLTVDSATGKRPDIKSQADIVRLAGYAASVENVPHTVLNTYGYDTALQELGFNPETAKKVVESIMLNEEAQNKDRLKASDMVFKVHGTYAAEKHVNLNVDVEVPSERVAQIAAMMKGE